MLITALIPCYNGEQYVAGAIESVRAQTRAVNEILVIDDGSTDRSAEVARDAGATVHTLPQNAGPSHVRNVGLGRARGDLVAFLDADDRWVPEHCAIVGGLAEKAPEAVVAFGRSALIQFPDMRSSAGLPEGRAVDAWSGVAERVPDAAWRVVGTPSGHRRGASLGRCRARAGCVARVRRRVALRVARWLAVGAPGGIGFRARHARGVRAARGSVLDWNGCAPPAVAPSPDRARSLAAVAGYAPSRRIADFLTWTRRDRAASGASTTSAGPTPRSRPAALHFAA